MTTKPYYNAVLAILYISLVVTGINLTSHLNIPESNQMYLVPVGMLSLFVISAAVMGYIVLYQPIKMFLDGQRNEAIKLFWQTIAIFAGIAAAVLLMSLLVVK